MDLEAGSNGNSIHIIEAFIPNTEFQCNRLIKENGVTSTAAKAEFSIRIIGTAHTYISSNKGLSFSTFCEIITCKRANSPGSEIITSIQVALATNSKIIGNKNTNIWLHRKIRVSINRIKGYITT